MAQGLLVRLHPEKRATGAAADRLPLGSGSGQIRDITNDLIRLRWDQVYREMPNRWRRLKAVRAMRSCCSRTSGGGWVREKQFPCRSDDGFRLAERDGAGQRLRWGIGASAAGRIADDESGCRWTRVDQRCGGVRTGKVHRARMVFQGWSNRRGIVAHGCGQRTFAEDYNGPVRPQARMPVRWKVALFPEIGGCDDADAHAD